MKQTENELSYLIRGAAYTVQKKLGPGLLESVYERALTHELIKIGLSVRNQVGIPMVYDGIKFDCGYRLDILVNERIIVEVKSVDTLMDIHHKQLLTYLKLLNLHLGILINFNSMTLDRSSMVRILNGYTSV
jgi:GxxExxY protein